MDTFPQIKLEVNDGWTSEEDEGKDGVDASAQTSRCAPVTSDDLDQLESWKNDANTVRQTQWAVNCFQTWLGLTDTNLDVQSVEKTELNSVLRRFYGSIRTTKGELYSISSYLGLRAGLNRYINEPPLSRAWNLMQDPEFTSANNVFKGVVKEIRRAGRDKTMHHPPISPEDQNILKYSAALSPDNPKGLLNKVWFDIQLHFGRRGKEGNRDLRPDSFVLRRDENGAKFFTFNEETRTSKDPPENRRGLMFEEPGNPLCPVASLEKYLSKIPPEAKALYLQPRRLILLSDSVWYTNAPLGVNQLSQMLSRMCREAGTRTTYTNHSLRITAIQRQSEEARGGGHRAPQIPQLLPVQIMVQIPQSVPVQPVQVQPVQVQSVPVQSVPVQPVPVQLLRVSVHERLVAAAEAFVLQVEKGEFWAEVPALRALLTERLTAAAEEIVALLEETVAEYEDRVERSEREIQSQRRLLDALLKPQVRLTRADVQQLLAREEEVPPEQQERSPSLDQEDPPEPPHIKEEQEELWSSQEGEQLPGLEEADITKFTVTPVPVKSEEDDGEEPPSSQLHQRQPEQMEADGEDCGGPGPATNSDPEDRTSELLSVAEIEVSCDDCEEAREPQSGLTSEDSAEKPFSCSECGKKFTRSSFLETHMRTHMGDKPFSCSFCGKKYTIYKYLMQHMLVHTGEKPASCRLCNRRLVWRSGVERHRCDTSECDKHLCYSHHLKNDSSGAHQEEEKLFCCSVCGRKFTQRGYLTQHMARHTGKIRYRCCVCDKRFAWRHELKSHKCDGGSSQSEEDLQDRMVTGEDGADRGSNSEDAETSDSSDSETEPVTETQPGSNCEAAASESKLFICSECGKTFCSKENLDVHMITHTGEQPFSCSFCGKKYTIYKYLMQHMLVHTGEKPASCRLCNRRLVWRSGVERHRCDTSECDKRLCYSHHLKNDSSGAHQEEEKLFCCSVCGRKFTQRGYLTQHMARHTGKIRYRCCVCDKRFAWRHELKSHKCDGGSSQSEEDLQDRMETGEDGADRGSNSDDAETSDSSDSETVTGAETELGSNCEAATSDRKSFICSDCGKMFCSEKNLNVHMKTHVGEEPFSCSFCEKGFKQKEFLTSSASAHSEEKRFLYCVCGKRFAWRYNLKNQKSVGEESQLQSDDWPPASSCRTSDSSNHHTDENSESQSNLNNDIPEGDGGGDTKERPFSCSQCRKRFRRKKNLQEHLRIHTGEKPYGCSVCMKYFSCSGSLRKHMRIHTGEKPFSCSVCGNRFTESGHLKVHMRTHTGEKPFSCSVCGKSFTWRQSFNNHMKYHRDEQRNQLETQTANKESV